MQFEGRPHYHCLESSILATKATLEGYNYTPFKWICSYLDLVGFEATEIHIFLCTLWQGEEQVEVSGRGFCKEYHLKWGGDDKRDSDNGLRARARLSDHYKRSPASTALNG